MSVYLQDPDFTLHQGDVLDELRNMPDESVHMCCTSPPFYGLRDYGTGEWEGGKDACDHRRDPTGGDRHGSYLAAYVRPETGKPTGGSQKKRSETGKVFHDVCGKCGARRVDQQIGLEPTPDEYVARLVEVFREVRRVLRDDGTCWVELGDSYAGSWGNQGRKPERGTQRPINGGMLTPVLDGRYPNSGSNTGAIPEDADYKPKDLLGIPWLVAFALRADGWWLRSDIVWVRPNPMPESVTDRPTKSHSYVFLLSKSSRYFFDQEAIREPLMESSLERGYSYRDPATYVSPKKRSNPYGVKPEMGKGQVPSGRNVRSVWTIPTQPYPEAHFATWPEKLVEPMILAGTSERGVCPECGAPWQRVTERGDIQPLTPSDSGRQSAWTKGDAARDPATRTDTPLPRHHRPVVATDWQPTCACYGCEDGPVAPAVVLDPFGGSGTTAHVARKLGRRAVLIELNADYCALAARRLQQQSLFA